MKTDDGLTRCLAGLGMRFGAEPDWSAPIEETLAEAMRRALRDEDMRTAAVVTRWLYEHAPVLHGDVLAALVRRDESDLVRAYWRAIAEWQRDLRALAPLRGLYTGPRVALLGESGAFHVARRGEDERFRETCLIVPAGTLRDRARDVMQADELARFSEGYRKRIETQRLAA